VYYRLWEDRAPSKSFTSTRLNYQNRLEPDLPAGVVWGSARWNWRSRASPMMMHLKPVTGKNLIRAENTGFLRYFPESSAA
jgi:hypothetical protein